MSWAAHNRDNLNCEALICTDKLPLTRRRLKSTLFFETF